MTKKIIITNGSGGSGKDTFYNFLNGYKNLRCCKYSSIDYIKYVAKGYLGWTGKKTEKDRRFLSDLKLACSNYNDLPFEKVKFFLDDFLKEDNSDEVAVIDIREPEEIRKIVNYYEQFVDVITVLIIRLGTKPINSNMADANVENYIYNHVITNSSTLENFKKRVQSFADDYILN